MTLPLFQGGQLSANLRQAKAAYEETVARYRQTVLTAFADVENNLAAEHLLASQYEEVLAALKAARRQLEIANNRYDAGLVTYLEVATAQNTTLGIERSDHASSRTTTGGHCGPDQITGRRLAGAGYQRQRTLASSRWD